MGCVMSTKKPRAFKCSEPSRSPIVDTGANGTRPRLYLFVEIEYGLLADPFLEKNPERLPVLSALEPVGENLLARPLGITHHVDEVLPLMLLDATQEDPAVLALHRFHWLNRLAPQPRRHHSPFMPEPEGQ